MLFEPCHPDVSSEVFFLPPVSHLLFFSALHILSHMPVISRRCPLCVQMSNGLKGRKLSESKNADCRALLKEKLFLLQTCHAYVRLIIVIAHHMLCGRVGWNMLFQVDDGLLSCLAVEISAWFGYPRPAADTTQPEELPGTWSDGAMVRQTQNEKNYE